MRPRCTGISAQVLPEYAPASFRNQRPGAAGIDAQVTPEYAARGERLGGLLSFYYREAA
jgi:hypothetical protein